MQVYVIDPKRRMRVLLPPFVFAVVLYILLVIAGVWRTEIAEALCAGPVIQLMFCLVVSLMTQRLVTTLIRQVTLRDMSRSVRAFRRGKYEMALKAAEAQLAKLEKQPLLENTRTLLLLDISMYSLRERVLLHLAALHYELGSYVAGFEAIKDVLESNPENGMALSMRNIVRISGGGEPDTLPHIPFSRSGNPLGILLTLGIAWVCGLSFYLISLLLIPWGQAFDGAPWLGHALVLGTVTGLVFFALLIYSQLMTRLMLKDFVKAARSLRQFDYPAALAAFNEQEAFMNEHPWIDRLRALIFFNVTKHNTYEAIWRSKAFAYIQLGRIEDVLANFERILEQIPELPGVRGTVHMIRAVQADPALADVLIS